MKITIVQTSLEWEDKEKNLSLLEKKISSIHDETDLIILPEMFSTGFSMNAKTLAEKMNGVTIEWMRQLSERKNCAITGSLIIEEDGKYFNRLIWMTPEGFQYYDKRHLFSLAHEEKTYTPGKKRILIEYKGWKILPLICYDLRFPVWSRRTKENDYDLLIYVANWPERRNTAWINLLPARAIENQGFVAGVNRTGSDGNNIYHAGDSAVYNYKGERISKMPSSDEVVETVALDIDTLRDFRKQFAFFDDADSFNLNL